MGTKTLRLDPTFATGLKSTLVGLHATSRALTIWVDRGGGVEYLFLTIPSIVVFILVLIMQPIGNGMGRSPLIVMIGNSCPVRLLPARHL